MKKVALISDIQGNCIALTQVLTAIKDEQVDAIVCLGDVASGAQPRDVLSTLRDYQVHMIKGNMDDEILNPQPYDGEDEIQRRYNVIDRWCSAQLTDSDKAYMRTFRHLILFELESAHQLLCFHGSPYSYNDVIDEETPDKRLGQLLDGYDEEIMASGHMHHQFLRPYKDTLLLNPGSVGLPRVRQTSEDELPRHPLLAEYALIEIIDGQINVQFRSLAVPPEEFKRSILNSGMPYAEWFLSLWKLD